MTDKDSPPPTRPARKSAGRLGFITGGVRIRRNKEMVIGGAIILVFVIVALAVEVAALLHIQITPYNPIDPVGPPLAAPSLKYLFGTDQLGRDVFSRIITATPNGFSIGFAVVGIALLGRHIGWLLRGVPRGPLRRGADEGHRHLLRDPRPDPRHSHRGETGTGHNDDDVRANGGLVARLRRASPGVRRSRSRTRTTSRRPRHRGSGRSR